MKQSVEDTLPILMRYSTPRREEPALPGRYSDEYEMWVVTTPDGEQPAMSLPQTSDSLRTKTNTNVEQDDDASLYLSNMLQTKTEAQLESEDQPKSMLAAFLQTKTDSNRESDDTTSMLI